MDKFPCVACWGSSWILLATFEILQDAKLWISLFILCQTYNGGIKFFYPCKRSLHEIAVKNQVPGFYSWEPYHYWVVITTFQEQEIDGEIELLVLASDGLWDVVPNEVRDCSFLFIFSLIFFQMLSFAFPSGQLLGSPPDLCVTGCRFSCPRRRRTRNGGEEIDRSCLLPRQCRQHNMHRREVPPRQNKGERSGDVRNQRGAKSQLVYWCIDRESLIYRRDFTQSECVMLGSSKESFVYLIMILVVLPFPPSSIWACHCKPYWRLTFSSCLVILT